MTIEMIIGLIAGVILGTVASKIDSKIRAKNDLKKYLKSTKLTKPQLEAVRKYLNDSQWREESDGEHCDMRREYIEMLEKHGGSYPKWPEGPEIRDEADVTPMKKGRHIRSRLSRRPNSWL